MGFLDRLLGREQRHAVPDPIGGRTPAAPGASDDERAIERYRYLLRTAPPEQIEQAHGEAFAALTPQQRQQVLQSLTEQAPPGEQPSSDAEIFGPGRDAG